MTEQLDDQLQRLRSIEAKVRAAGGDPRLIERLRGLEDRVASLDGVEPTEEPEASPRAPHRQLTIGMACYGDFDGVFFTVNALRLYHPEVTDRSTIVVLDNAPWLPEAAALKALEDSVQNYRYVPAGDITGTAVRNRIFHEANSDWVTVIDSHVLLQPGSLARLLDFLDADADTANLYQGPMLAPDMGSVVTHMAPEWRDGMFGTWALDERGESSDGTPFEIPMHGLGLFVCHAGSWPGLNPRFRGFGGEEGYIHEKFRRAGGQTICLPFLRWFHRFARPSGPQYPVTWEDRIRNYMIGFYEADLDLQSIIDHFNGVLGADVVTPIVANVSAEIRNPFWYFDAIYCINLDNRPKRWREMQRRFAMLGIENRVQRFSAVETPDLHHVGCALSHRAVVEHADRLGLDNVLVFEDDALLRDDTLECLGNSLRDLMSMPDWNVFYLGAKNWDIPTPSLIGNCRHLADGHRLHLTHALAYNRPFFKRFLDNVPSHRLNAHLWVQGPFYAIDWWLAYGVNSGKYITNPELATQEFLVDDLPVDERKRYAWQLDEPPSAAESG